MISSNMNSPANFKLSQARVFLQREIDSLKKEGSRKELKQANRDLRTLDRFSSGEKSFESFAEAKDDVNSRIETLSSQKSQKDLRHRALEFGAAAAATGVAVATAAAGISYAPAILEGISQISNPLLQAITPLAMFVPVGLAGAGATEVFVEMSGPSRPISTQLIPTRLDEAKKESATLDRVQKLYGSQTQGGESDVSSLELKELDSLRKLHAQPNAERVKGLFKWAIDHPDHSALAFERIQNPQDPWSDDNDGLSQISRNLRTSERKTSEFQDPASRRARRLGVALVGSELGMAKPEEGNYGRAAWKLLQSANTTRESSPAESSQMLKAGYEFLEASLLNGKNEDLKMRATNAMGDFLHQDPSVSLLGLASLATPEEHSKPEAALQEQFILT